MRICILIFTNPQTLLLRLNFILFLFYFFFSILFRGKMSVIYLKFSCSRPELYEIVSNVSRAVSGKTSLAVLEGILIRAKGDTLSFLGYDLDLGISAQMGAQVEEEGEIVLSAKLFVDMMRRMNGDTVTVRTDEKYLTEIKSGATEFTILGIPS